MSFEIYYNSKNDIVVKEEEYDDEEITFTESGRPVEKKKTKTSVKISNSDQHNIVVKTEQLDEEEEATVIQNIEEVKSSSSKPLDKTSNHHIILKTEQLSEEERTFIESKESVEVNHKNGSNKLCMNQRVKKGYSGRTCNKNIYSK